MPNDLFSVKYTEKHRWRKILELLKEYNDKDFDLILKIERTFDPSKVGITIDGDMYYNYGYCPKNLNSDYTCYDNNVSVNFIE